VRDILLLLPLLLLLVVAVPLLPEHVPLRQTPTQRVGRRLLVQLQRRMLHPCHCVVQ
jgi:hypothetical protein